MRFLLEKRGRMCYNKPAILKNVALASIAPSLAEAAALNEVVKAVMDQLPYLAEEVFGSELNGDYNFTNTATKERRYQAVYNITYKE